MSVDQIGGLVEAANRLTNEVAGKLQEINQKVDQATQAVPDAVRKMASQAFTVNQATGDDANSGFADAPLRTLKEAVARTPVSDVCFVTLVGDYHMDEVLEYGCDLYINGTEVGNSVPRDIPKITFGTHVVNVVQNGLDYLRTKGFIPTSNNSIAFRDVHIVIPDDSVDPTARKNGFSGCIRHQTAETTAVISVVLIDCQVERPANPVYALVGAGYVLTLAVRATQIIGEPMEGWWWDGGPGHDLVAGTDPATIGHLINTNLAVI